MYWSHIAYGLDILDKNRISALSKTSWNYFFFVHTPAFKLQESKVKSSQSISQGKKSSCHVFRVGIEKQWFVKLCKANNTVKRGLSVSECPLRGGLMKKLRVEIQYNSVASKGKNLERYTYTKWQQRPVDRLTFYIIHS
jgi:hypothetical protein